MQTGHCTIECRSKPKKLTQYSLLTVYRICAGAGFFCGVFAFGVFQWIYG